MDRDIYSKDIESNVLGCLIVFEECRRYIKQLEEKDFYEINNRKIFNLILELFEQQKAIDLISIKELAKEKKLKSEEVFKYLVKITELTITSAEIEYHISKLKNFSIRRQIITKTKEIESDMYKIESDTPSAEIKKQAIEKITDIRTTKDLSSSDMQNVMMLATQNIEKKYQRRDDHTYETGFFEYDKATNGLHEQELTIVAARPGTGKTAFALNIAERLSQKRSLYLFC